MLRGGFIGFGRMGITHFSILNTHPDVKITCICDQSVTMLKILEKYLNNITLYSNYKEMIDKEDLDFVVISTPSDSHAEIIKYAIDHDLHIFTEKPLALTEQEGKEILNKLKGKNIINQVGYVNRFNEIFMEVKKLIDDGIIGEIKSFCSEMYGGTILRDAKSNWRGKKSTGGGCLYEFASHCIDLVLYFFGMPNRIIGSVMQSVYSSQVEDLVFSTFVYDDKGFSGIIIANWSDESYRKPTNIFRVFGTKGKIIADKHEYKIYLRENIPNKKEFHEGWNVRYITDFAKSVRFYVRGNEFTRQLDYFIECIKKRQQGTVCGFYDAFITDIVIGEIKRNASKNLLSKNLSISNSNELDNNNKEEEKNKLSFWKRILGL